MRLLTHNMLQCHAKRCSKPGADNFPLRLAEVTLTQETTEYNPDFLRHLLPKLEWSALVTSAIQLGNDRLPKELPEQPDDDFLLNLHGVLMETNVEEGQLICNSCGHIYPVKDGIPNMLLQETEI